MITGVCQESGLPTIPIGTLCENIVGRKVNRLTILSRAPNKGLDSSWNCRCECGNFITVRRSSVLRGRTKSCGCLVAEGIRESVVRRISEGKLRVNRAVIGQKFGRLTVVGSEGYNKHNEEVWMCLCDCGSRRKVAARKLTTGVTKSCGCLQKEDARKRGFARVGSQCGAWRGGFRYKDPNRGYVTVYTPEKADHRRDRRVYEHVLVMEKHLGRPIAKGESVHHKNGIKDDNRIENLELWSRAQPAGQRITDQVAWAIQLLARYEPDALAPAREEEIFA